jgi:hypothetical protein
MFVDERIQEVGSKVATATMQVIHGSSGRCGLGLFLLFFGACASGVGNTGTLVGAACTADAECEQRCEQGGDYPEGICTSSCDSDETCPAQTHCINKDGGICLLGCELSSDCRGGYSCEGKENKARSGDSLVCISD